MIQEKSARRPAPSQPAWLLLVHQLPAQPSNVRVKVWRRLQNLGALPVKNSVYVLPNSAQAQEDFQWLKTEIEALKGQATVFTAHSVDSRSAEELVAAFRRARQQDYERLRRDTEKLLARARSGQPRASVLRRRFERNARLLRERYSQIEAIDFFQAPARQRAATALAQLERLLQEQRPPPAEASPAPERLKVGKFRARLWVTRPRPGIDRMASAWLIRRFIDPAARFSFVDRPAEAPRAVPFDMFGVEFSHHGNHCTFETLVERFGLEQKGVEWLGHIVHDLDLKEETYALPEGAAVGRLVEGLQQLYRDDRELLEQGMTLFEALYRSRTPSRSPAAKPARGRSRSKRARR